MTKKMAAISFALGLSALLLVAAAQSKSKAKEAPRDILGIRIGMRFEDAHKRLEKIGRLEREERKRQEIWTVNKDPRFSHLLVGFDKDGSVRYVTVLAREGHGVRYNDLFDSGKARVTSAVNNYHYTLEVSGRKGQPDYLVMAQGSDPTFLSSFSLKKKTDQ